MNTTIEVSQPPVTTRHQPALTRRRGGQVLLGFPLAGLMLAYVLPRALGTSLQSVRAALGALSAADLIALTVVWAAGLFTHSYVLTGALPGLSRRRALTLNLTGSAVSNLLPFGGAAGMSLNYTMLRAWKVTPAGFVAYTVVTNTWVVLLKLTLPAAAMFLLVATDTPVGSLVRDVAVAAAIALLVVVSLMLIGLGHRRTAVRAATAARQLVAAVRRRAPRDAADWSTHLVECRDVVVDVVSRRWPQLSVGMLGYAALQCLLLWACVHVVGGHLTTVQVLAGYAVDRVLTLAVLTPGGAGVAETGIAATLVALGGAPAAMAAAVLLYRCFTFALEIPVGGAWLAGWLAVRRMRAKLLPEHALTGGKP